MGKFSVLRTQLQYNIYPDLPHVQISRLDLSAVLFLTMEPCSTSTTISGYYTTEAVGQGLRHLDLLLPS